MSIVIEKHLRVWNEDEGAYLEISLCPDFPDAALQIHTGKHKTSEEWYGKVDITLYGKEQAVKLAQAILEMSELIK